MKRGYTALQADRIIAAIERDAADVETALRRMQARVPDTFDQVEYAIADVHSRAARLAQVVRDRRRA